MTSISMGSARDGIGIIVHICTDGVRMMQLADGSLLCLAQDGLGS